MAHSITSLRALIDEMHSSSVSLLEGLEEASKTPPGSYPLKDSKKLVMDMQDRKEGITYEDLALQTGLSRSTITRIFKDPTSSKMDNFLAIADELGLKITVEAKS